MVTRCLSVPRQRVVSPESRWQSAGQRKEDTSVFSIDSKIECASVWPASIALRKLPSVFVPCVWRQKHGLWISRACTSCDNTSCSHVAAYDRSCTPHHTPYDSFDCACVHHAQTRGVPEANGGPDAARNWLQMTTPPTIAADTPPQTPPPTMARYLKPSIGHPCAPFSVPNQTKSKKPIVQ